MVSLSLPSPEGKNLLEKFVTMNNAINSYIKKEADRRNDNVYRNQFL